MLYLIMIGLSPKRKWLKKTARTCPMCGACALMQTRVDQRLSLFFIPLFPIVRGHRAWICHRCGYVDRPGARVNRNRAVFPVTVQGQAGPPPAYVPDKNERALAEPSTMKHSKDLETLENELAMDHCDACGAAIGSSNWRFCPRCGRER
ncbi:hypothetical protein BDF22DRAFT_244559 [Syncephalis plumigaleata]|nr:hypothetical protein BDF22DRAFT_244559 [Syncephalis plumigaleata]